MCWEGPDVVRESHACPYPYELIVAARFFISPVLTSRNTQTVTAALGFASPPPHLPAHGKRVGERRFDGLRCSLPASGPIRYQGGVATPWRRPWFIVRPRPARDHPDEAKTYRSRTGHRTLPGQTRKSPQVVRPTASHHWPCPTATYPARQRPWCATAAVTTREPLEPS